MALFLCFHIYFCDIAVEKLQLQMRANQYNSSSSPASTTNSEVFSNHKSKTSRDPLPLHQQVFLSRTVISEHPIPVMMIHLNVPYMQII